MKVSREAESLPSERVIRPCILHIDNTPTFFIFNFDFNTAYASIQRFSFTVDVILNSSL